MDEQNLLDSQYETKQVHYFAQDREEMIQYLPPNARRILDVGCAEGAFGALVKARLNAEVWGVEPNDRAYAKARSKLDQVFCCQFEAMESTETKFDCVCFNDVLEHMIKPELALIKARSLLEREGTIVACIPNFRYFPNLWEIVRWGDFEYKSSGVLDATHLRFFTKKSMTRLFENVGLKVLRIAGTGRWKSWKLTVLRMALMGALEECQYQAYVVVAANR